MELNFSVAGLGHPPRWHVSIQNDFATRNEAEELATKISDLWRLQDETLILIGDDAKRFLEYNNRDLSNEEKEKLKEADDFYRKMSNKT